MAERQIEADIANHLSSLFRICHVTLRPDVQVAEAERMFTSLTGKSTGPAAPAVFRVMADVIYDTIQSLTLQRDHDMDGKAVLPETIVRVDVQHRSTIAIRGITHASGFALTLDGHHVIFSNFMLNHLCIYSLKTGECASTLGEKSGLATGQFHPSKICVTVHGTILVASSRNYRIQEVTSTGAHVRIFDIDELKVWDGISSMCMQGDLVAVGRRGGYDDGRVALFSYSTGKCLLKFGSYGTGAGQISRISSLTFAPDSIHILVATNSALSLFDIEGAFLCTIGAGCFHRGNASDVLYSGSSIFATDTDNHCIRVFAANTGTLIRTLGLGADGGIDGQFNYPRLLAAHGNKLFVLDNLVLQMFE